ncbi:hypothetical protein BDK89_2367 [Ilumatobacter fluminis]|uniref:DUF3499 family protein n=2 Tax=Ilumatobacter fluminis TaxID=467091 RepID=A0A4R7I0S2_9ACTN|nr:hypothetical protein BDK89_2367 [Ilumatobacter fluminis]
MVPEDLLFWIAPLADSPVDEPSVLCARHADAMVVPRGWTLDDRRESTLRLFKPRPTEPAPTTPRRSTRRAAPADSRPEQLQIDGTGEISRPAELPDDIVDTVPDGVHDGDHDTASTPADGSTEEASGPSADPWAPAFDHDDDLNGLLEVSSPLLSRAFRGTDRPRH